VSADAGAGGTRVDAGAMMERLGIEWLEVSPERVVARLPVRGNTQPYGILHGGATAALCETVGSVGTAVAAGVERLPVGIELNVNHLRSVSDGWITATGVPVQVGNRVAVWEMRVRDDGGRLIAVGRLTLLLTQDGGGAPPG
jgi:uncharacterized protein (TIGR00369 family)